MKRPRGQFERGNYQGYYRYRKRGHGADGASEDDRFKLLQESWFRGKDCLDVGCNVGHLTRAIAAKFGAGRMLGIDVDASLVSRAAELQGGAGDGVSFLCEDALDCELPDGSFDTVSCFSVSKWVHLHYGDDGVRDLFRTVRRLLRPGGLFVLEAQPWRSYRKNRHASERARRNFRAIRLRPADFPAYLLSDEGGFSSFEDLGRPGSAIRGFDRPIWLLRKAGASGSAAGGDGS